MPDNTMHPLTPLPARSRTDHVFWPRRALVGLLCAGLLMCLLGLLVNAKTLPTPPLQPVTDMVSAAHGHTATMLACSATQLQGTCTDADQGDWADLDVLPALPLAMHVLRVLHSIETRTPLIQVGVQPGLPPPRSLG